MLCSIDSCQNRVSADQYRLTSSRAQGSVSTHQGGLFLWSYPLTNYQFSKDRKVKFNFFFCIECVYAPHKKSCTIKILMSNWPRTRKFSQLLHGHAMVTVFVQFQCSDWSNLDRWVHAENLCSIWKLVYRQLKLTEFRALILWCF